MNANCPPGIQKSSGDIVRYLNELLGISTSALMGVVIPLEVLLSSAALTGNAEYRVPAGTDLVVFQIHTSWRSTLLATEPALNAIITALTVEGLAEARLSNCLAQLRIKDRKLDVFDNGDANMAGLYKNPSFFLPHAPLIVPAASTLQAVLNLQDATAAVVGNPAYYGLMLTGVLIPHKV